MKGVLSLKGLRSHARASKVHRALRLHYFISRVRLCYKESIYLNVKLTIWKTEFSF